MLRHSITVQLRLYREFPRLQKQYRAHLGQLTSPASWTEAFGAVSDGRSAPSDRPS
jgi:galactofuranosylgalactofuranosylrhamnosyl-N-acetylglucosaminyl-diphospho-decaprenol beta-1,5/1,6-galactofuranosyltransferase